MPRKSKLAKDRLRVSAPVVMDVDSLERARQKAAQHGMPFAIFMEQACRLYGKYLDKKISVIARPI
jgi:hypothetical protein